MKLQNLAEPVVLLLFLKKMVFISLECERSE